MPRLSKWQAQHKGCQAAVDNLKADLTKEIERLREENARLSAWALQAYTFIQASPCHCGSADECEAHTLIFEYQQQS